MKTQTQRQLQMFRDRMTAIAAALDAEVTFPDKGEDQSATITIEKNRAIQVSHDLFRGQFKATGVWPRTKGGRTHTPTENKTFRLDWTKSDDDIVKGLKDRYLPWYEVEVELIEEKLSEELQERDIRAEAIMKLAELFGVKIKKDPNNYIHQNFEGKTAEGKLEARVDEVSVDKGATIRLTIDTTVADAENILAMLLPAKK
jgi:hypothetical protein